jgi:hypothetical protein
MSYVVEWLPDAEQELAEIWLSASDRVAITHAADWMTWRPWATRSRTECRAIHKILRLQALRRTVAGEHDLQVGIARGFEEFDADGVQTLREPPPAARPLHGMRAVIFRKQFSIEEKPAAVI